MTIITIPRGHWFKPCLVALCALVLTSMTPRKAAAQELDEYGLLAGLITIVQGEMDDIVQEPDIHLPLGHLSSKLHDDFLAALEGHLEGDRAQEIAYLGRVDGVATALMGMTSPCDVCGELREDLQQVIDIAADLKLRAQAKKKDDDDRP